MNEQTFVDRRQADWKRLSYLCDLADRTPSRLSADELREMVRLYRRVSTDLAIARTRVTSLPLIEQLNDLAGRAYGILYRAPRKPFWPSLVDAIASAAQTVRRRWAFVLASAILFFGSAFFSFGVLHSDTDTRDYFVKPGMEDLIKHWKSGFEDRAGTENLLYAGFYASNNPKVAIVTGAVGAGTFGVGSIYLLLQNGYMLGTLASELAPAGKLDFLLSSVAPHGVPELSGAILAGSAGLLFGFALINPGRRKRGDALRAVGKDGITLLGASVVMMFIAAPIEGFFSFNPIVPGWFKVMVAAIEIVAWGAFWTSYGRSAETREESSAR